MNSNLRKKMKKGLIENASNKDEMKKAINSESFYVVATPCLIGYSIGCFDN
jgi:hypothetical protein